VGRGCLFLGRLRFCCIGERRGRGGKGDTVLCGRDRSFS
jgi:hypothetical protein